MITITAASIYPFLLAFARAGGLILLLPVFSGSPIPNPIRVAIAALLGFLVARFVPATEMPAHWLLFVVAIGHEFFAGLLMGLAARLLFFALELAGQLISTEIGLMLSSDIDPITRSLGSPCSSLLFYFGTVLFLLTGAHHYSLLAFARSFEVFPPNAAFSPATAQYVITQSGSIFLLAVQIAAPVMAVNFVVNLAFSALGRAAPAIDVYGSSFPVRIMAGLAVFGATFGLTAQYVYGGLEAFPEMMLRFLR